MIRASKTDQRRAGARVFVPNGGALCPVRALKRWLVVSGIEAGALFRRISRADRVLAARLSGQGIATAIKRAGEAAGLDPDTLGGHSLGAGFVTEAARRGETAFRIMATTRPIRAEPKTASGVKTERTRANAPEFKALGVCKMC